MTRLQSQILGLLLTLLMIHSSQAEEANESPSAKHWPFTPRLSPSPPPLPQNETAHNEIDNFIVHKLQQSNLSLAAGLDRAKLARRIYFDLIGLPPTPEELRDFVQDPAPEAYESLVDRLLEDPRHGERWARFWLDIARYADTAGYEGDPDLPYAWRYRDYVIDSFNQDKPSDLFIKEQIAGDEFKEIMGAGDLPQSDPERTVALTFLRLAPFTEPRGDETRHEMLSEMTSTVSSAFLGLTVGCAQCHDHKYDPIPTQDFYRMKAFFSTVWLKRPEPGDIYQIGAPLPAGHYRNGEKDHYQQKKKAYRDEIERSKQALEELTQEFTQRLGPPKAGFGMQSSGSEIGNNYYYEQTPVFDGSLHVSIVNATLKGWQFFTDGEPQTELSSLSGKNKGHWFDSISQPNYLAIGQQTNPARESLGNEHKGQIAEVLIYDHPLNEAERNQLNTYSKAKYHTGSSSLQLPPNEGLAFWLDASDPDNNAETATPKPGQKLAIWTDKINGIQLRQDHEDAQPTYFTPSEGKAPTLQFDQDLLVSDAAKAPFLSHSSGAIVMIYTVEQGDEGYGFSVGNQNSFVSTVVYPNKGENADLKALLADASNPIFTQAERDLFDHLSNRERFLKQHIKRLEPMAMSLRHSYGPPFEPGVPVSRVMLRGEHDNPGDVVQAGFPSAITGTTDPAEIRLDPFKRWPTRSRRMTLANWIASPDNPLTSRVIVNRLWHWHFGRGLVRTPSDFGRLSGGPSHPELLDWLANYLVDQKWRLKAIHRLIVTSRTYRQASQIRHPQASQIDPENTLLWRFNPRRLEAEAIRDTVLQVSGRLNTELYGPPIFPELPGGIAQQVKYDNSKWDTDYSDRARKRSIYIYQQRTLSMPFLQSFDALVCEDSRPMRRSSTTPLQALAMYNGKLVNEESDHFANRIKQHSEELEERVRWAYQVALSRMPSDQEIERLKPLAQDNRLPQLARILFNTNEFVYID